VNGIHTLAWMVYCQEPFSQVSFPNSPFCGMVWKIQTRFIRLEPGETKNDDACQFSPPQELYEVLVMQKSIRNAKYPECPWVFFWYSDGSRICDFRVTWGTACKSIGLADVEDKPTRLFHDLRHTGVQNLIRAGVPERVAMKISGHRSRFVFDRNNIVSERDLQEAAQQLGQYIEGKNAALKGKKGLSTLWAHQHQELEVSETRRGAKLLN
jgi:integrase-like protein